MQCDEIDLCEFWGFVGGEAEVSVLLGYDDAFRPLKMRPLRCLKTLRTDYPVKRCRIPEQPKPQIDLSSKHPSGPYTLRLWSPQRILLQWTVLENYPWFQASAVMLTRSALFWASTQRRVVILYWRFGTTYRSVFKGQEVQEVFLLALFDPWRWDNALSRKVVKDYHSTLRNIPEERRSQYWRSGHQMIMRLSCCVS
jgi:hypothetical protein